MAIISKIRIGNTTHEFPKNNDSIYSITITTSWSGSSAPYTQNITVSGLLTTDVPIPQLIPSSTYATAQAEVADFAKIYKYEVTSANTLKVYATEALTHALTVKLCVVR